jgi:hypothetical protein
VRYGRKLDPRPSLRTCGASDEELALLASSYDRGDARWAGHRVELNAMTTPQLLAWLEAKLQQHGVTKVVPQYDTLATVWRYYTQLAWMDTAIAQARAEMPEATAITVPDDLEARVRTFLSAAGQSALPWEAAIEALVTQASAPACDA